MYYTLLVAVMAAAPVVGNWSGAVFAVVAMAGDGDKALPLPSRCCVCSFAEGGQLPALPAHHSRSRQDKVQCFRDQMQLGGAWVLPTGSVQASRTTTSLVFVAGL